MANYSTGFISPTSAVEDSSIGTTAWNNESNIISSNNSRASGLTSAINDETHYIRPTGFDWSIIPSHAIVKQIHIRIERANTTDFNAHEDNSLRLYLSGAFVGNNKAVAGAWSGGAGSETYVDYDHSVADWGLSSLRGSDVKAGALSLGFSIKRASGAGSSSGIVDHIEMELEYNLPHPGPRGCFF